MRILLVAALVLGAGCGGSEADSVRSCVPDVRSVFEVAFDPCSSLGMISAPAEDAGTECVLRCPR